MTERVVDRPRRAPAAPPSGDAGYTLAQVQQRIGLTRGAVSGLVAAGFVTPTRGPRGAWRFAFHDLLLLRTAHALRRARVAPRRIVSALSTLRRTLPDELPLAGLRITAAGNKVVVRDRGGATWEPDSGQQVLDFEVASVAGDVAFLDTDGDAAAGADAWFRAGQLAEGNDAAAAESAYRAALACDPAHVDASLNLGALLCERGRCDDADALYAAALAAGADDARLHFNHAIALEDRQQVDDALAAYERALDRDPRLADAHWNSALLLEARGDARAALRHYSAYRRLVRPAR